MPTPAATAELAVLVGVKKSMEVVGDDDEEPGDVLHQHREEEAG